MAYDDTAIEMASAPLADKTIRVNPYAPFMREHSNW
jgi:hypothetical protein